MPDAAADTTVIKLRVNGRDVAVPAADGDRSLLEVLREDLTLTGTKYGCGEGECGACTVLIDGRATRSCLLPISEVAGRTVTTLEGLGSAANLCALLVPVEAGGRGGTRLDLFKVVEAIGRGDGSAAWCVSACNTVTYTAYMGLGPEGRREVFGHGPVAGWTMFAPRTLSTPVDGGFRISGKWSFSSGVDNADWMLLGVFFGPPSGGSPIPDIRYVMLPKGDYKVIDDWFVSGLRGTGSKGIVVEDAFVPNHRICGLADMIQGKTPGSQIHDSPLYKASVWGIIPFTISSPANGMARGGLDAFLEDMKVREGSYDHSPLANKPGMHLVVAEASAMIDSADLLYRRSFRETIDKIMAGEPLSLEHRARSRRDQGWSVMQAKLAAEKLFSASAGRAIYEGNHVQRACADLHALQGHIVAGWEMPAYSYGQVMLGGQPSDAFT